MALKYFMAGSEVSHVIEVEFIVQIMRHHRLSEQPGWTHRQQRQNVADVTKMEQDNFGRDRLV